MAKSRFEYVRNYEIPDPLMPNTHIVIRVDGRGFHKFSDIHEFEKPNDVRALDLMNQAAKAVMDEFPDVVLAFGESDEFSFLMRRESKVYGRRRSKINSAVASIFSSAYVFYWRKYFPNTELRYPPTFDSRVVLYPGEKEVRDYFAWRQADTHINNLYNTSFWAVVHGGATPREANKLLQGTNSKDKNELLFSQYGVNYNNVPAYFRKGSILVRQDPNAIPVVIEAEPTPSATSSADITRPSSASNVVDLTDDVMPLQRRGSDSLFVPSRPLPQSALAPSTPSPTQPAFGDRPPAEDVPSTPIEAVSRQGKAAGVSSSAPKAPKAFDGISGEIVVLHEDLIRDPFWRARPWLLS